MLDSPLGGAVLATARGRDLYASAREVIADIEGDWATPLGATKMR